MIYISETHPGWIDQMVAPVSPAEAGGYSYWILPGTGSMNKNLQISNIKIYFLEQIPNPKPVSKSSGDSDAGLTIWVKIARTKVLVNLVTENLSHLMSEN